MTELTTRKRQFEKDCNLKRDYIPGWGKWEAMREIITNAIDADPDNYTVEFKVGVTVANNAMMVVTTTTAPSIEQVSVLGESTKMADDSKIGQFGEGLLMAALVLTRMRGCSLVILCPSGKITFWFKKAPGMNVATLHMKVEPKYAQSTTEVQVHASELQPIYEEKFLPKDAPIGPLKKEKGAKGMRVFAHGVLLKRVDERSLFDWNLDTATINRDRSLPDAWDLKLKIARKLGSIMEADDAMADKIIASPQCYEAQCCEASSYSEHVRRPLAEAFRRRFGDEACLQVSDTNVNDRARHKGNQPIEAGLLMGLLEGAGVPKATDLVCKADRLEVSDLVLPDSMREEANYLSDVLSIPINLQIAQDDGKTLGAVKWEGDVLTVWINERLLAPGQRHERLRTILHEIGHVKGGGDATPQFEASLDWIAATLADKLLDKR